jgi:phosphate uptake regulator
MIDRLDTYRRASELQSDLLLLAGALEEIGAHAIVQDQVAPVQNLVAAYGFHAAAAKQYRLQAEGF